METATRTEYNKTVKAMVTEEYLTYLFVKQADRQQYGELKKIVLEQQSQGRLVIS